MHLGPIAGFEPRYWNLKRAAGYYNWVRHRRSAYRRDVLDRIVADMQAQQPDHIVVTGDLANIGLPQEHVNALAWLKALGPPERVSVVPGNHDIYSRIGRDPGTRRWAPYMASDAQGADFVAAAMRIFRSCACLGQVALVGVNSAVPTPPLMAWGRVGREQLAAPCGRSRCAGARRSVPRRAHPPSAAAGPGLARTRPAGRGGTEAVLARHGAELVIHGHNHSTCWPGARGRPGGSRSSARRPRRWAGGTGTSRWRRYNLYRIDPASRSIALVGRGLAEPDGPIVELERRTLVPTDAEAERATTSEYINCSAQVSPRRRCR